MTMLPDRLNHAVGKILTQHRHSLESATQAVRLNDPKRILALGYSITLKDGMPVSDPGILRPGDIITTRFAQGEAHSEVLP